MKKSLKLITVYASALALACVDEKIKRGVEAGKINNSVIKQNRLFKIEKHHNSGFAGNRLDDRQEIVASVSSAMTSAQFCITGYMAANSESAVLNAANIMMLAGAVSNTKDRVCRRYVVDYLRIKDRIYNLSDFLIFAGALLNVIYAAAKAVKD